MQALVHIVTVAGLGVCLSAALPNASLAADAAASCGSLTFVQRRVVEKADQGVDALRQYMFATRGTHNLYMMDVATQLDAWRAKSRCADLVAALGAIPAVAVDRTAVATLRGDQSLTFPICPLGKPSAGNLCRVPPPPRMPLPPPVPW